MKKNKKYKFIVSIFIILIIILILNITIKIIGKVEIAKQEKIFEKENRLEEERRIEEYFEDKICPQNTLSLYKKYKGNNDKNNLYKRLKILVEELPEYIIRINNKNNNDLLVFYKENMDYLYEKFGIENEEEFLNLSNYLQHKNINKNEFEFCQIDEITFKEDNEKKYLTFTIVFNYSKEKIRLKTCFANPNNINPQVKFLTENNTIK